MVGKASRPGQVLPGHAEGDLRAAQTSLADRPVTCLRYVDEGRARLLSKLGIASVRDLLASYPRRYIDMSSVTTCAAAPIGETCTVTGTLDSVRLKRPKPRMQLVEASLVDDTGVLVAVWWSQPWMAKRLSPGMRVALSGKVAFSYGYKRMSSPFVDVLADAGPSGAAGDARADGHAAGMVLPVHRACAGLSASWMRRIISAALADADAMLDPVPARLRRRHRLMGRASALRAIHFPRSLAERDEARRRLAYDEVLRLQLHLLMRRDEELTGTRPVAHVTDGPRLGRLAAALPFELTDDQRAAISAILGDMAAPRCMNRLLEGDVGTGKTIVAAHALAAAADTGCQAAMMAPTGVLAAQYGAKLGPLLDEAGIRWATLTGATPAPERRRILSGLADGSIDVAFGTHALLEDDVAFSRLSLVVIDEQQRFGVGQRARLTSKGPGCDVLSMTATPIPRSLALTLYGDMECTYLRERPHAGARVTTVVLDRRRRDKAYEAIREALSHGHQAYVICPLVGASRAADGRGEGEEDDEAERRARVADGIAAGVDLSGAAEAEGMAAALQRDTFPDRRVGLLTGRMRPAEKDEVMRRFSAGEIDVLVSTTVVEVGVDVPNATVMLVEDAGQFGLAQLHQLRGRVGRGGDDATVYLLSDPRNKEAAARLSAVASTTDGVELAELDLASRHEGDVLGMRQHGASTLKLVDVTRDRELIEETHADARELLAADPTLSDAEDAPLAAELARVFFDVDDEAVAD